MKTVMERNPVKEFEVGQKMDLIQSYDISDVTNVMRRLRTNYLLGMRFKSNDLVLNSNDFDQVLWLDTVITNLERSANHTSLNKLFNIGTAQCDLELISEFCLAGVQSRVNDGSYKLADLDFDCLQFLNVLKNIF